MQIVTFDTVLSNSNILKHLPKYYKTIKLVKHNLTRFNYDNMKLNGLLMIIKRFENMLSGYFFQSTIEQLKQNKISISNKITAILSTHFLNYIKKCIANFMNNNNGPKQYHEVIRITIISVLYSHLFGNLEQRVIKSIHELNHKNYGITIIANNVWQPEVFMQKFGISSMQFTNGFNQQQYLNLKLQNLSKSTHFHAVNISNWLIKFQRMFISNNQNLTIDILNLKMKFIQDGICYATEINYMINIIINMHIILTLPIQKITLMVICKLIELLYAIKACYQLKNVNLIEILHCIVQNLQYQGLVIIASIKVSSRYNCVFISIKYIFL